MSPVDDSSDAVFELLDLPILPRRVPTPLLFWRAARLRCPHCGGRGLFRTPLSLNERCTFCGLLLQRGEADHFLGAYVLNLVAVELTVAITLVTIGIATWPNPPWALLKWGGVTLAVVMAFICYPFAKAFWLAVDLAFRPPTAAELDVASGAPREIAGELV